MERSIFRGFIITLERIPMLSAGLEMNADLASPKYVRNLFYQYLVRISNDYLWLNPQFLDYLPPLRRGYGEKAIVPSPSITPASQPSSMSVTARVPCGLSIDISWIFALSAPMSFRIFPHIAKFLRQAISIYSLVATVQALF